MTNIVLPKLNQTGANEWADVQDNDEAIKKVVNGELDTGNLKAGAGITRSQLAADAKPGTWYTPKIIATEESRTNTAYGALTTADEIKEVVVPANGLVRIGYQATWKGSVGPFAAAIFFGSNQLKKAIANSLSPLQVGVEAGHTEWRSLSTSSGGLGSVVIGSGNYTGDVTTGQVLGEGKGGGMCEVFVAAGTYTISVQYKATSGSVSAKERKLWVETRG